MTVAERLGLSDARERQLVRLLQLVLAGIFVYGLVTFRFGLSVNAAITLAVTFLPALLRREYDYHMNPGLVLWLAIAMLLHLIGSLGMYEQYQWYDEITHFVSSALVAGVGYATARAFELHSDEIDLPPDVRGVFIVVFVLAFGVIWEVFEFGTVAIAGYLGVDSPVQIFGIDDIVTDFVFNAIGAVLVALWGTEYFGGLVGFFRNRLSSTAEE